VSKISDEILKDKTVGFYMSSAISRNGNRRNERSKTLAALMFLYQRCGGAARMMVDFSATFRRFLGVFTI
jgi:hypothetical protein